MEDTRRGEEASTAKRRKPSSDTIYMRSPDVYKSLGLTDMPLQEFNELAELISSNFGIKVAENKMTLVTGRVYPMMERHGFANHRELLNALREDRAGQLMSELANRISTNHTAFYREETHFAYLLERALPRLVEKKGGDRDMRIWCAASASGEEAYTILFTLLKFFQLDYRNWHAGVLATDISADALAVAKRGVYTRARLEPVPRDVVGMCFRQVDADTFEVKPEFRKEVTFRRLNLMKDGYPFRKQFDIIFCRNVMIYFSRNIRTRLLAKMHDWLVPGGYLFIGHSESLIGPHPGYEYTAPSVYRRAD